MGCHVLLQGIFPTQDSDLHLMCLLLCRWILLTAEPLVTIVKTTESPSAPAPPHCLWTSTDFIAGVDGCRQPREAWVSPLPLPISCFHFSSLGADPSWPSPPPQFPTPNILSPAPGPLPPAALLWLSGSYAVCLLRVLAGDKGSDTTRLVMGNPEMVDFQLVPCQGYVGRHVFPNIDFCHHPTWWWLLHLGQGEAWGYREHRAGL